MLSCRQLSELVTDYLEGKMSLGDRMRFQMHLGMCKHCRAYVQQMKLTLQTLGTLPTEPMPDRVRAELLLRFQNWKR